jgi:sulfite exporter TauE/SafE/copper chaperone CopZ
MHNKYTLHVSGTHCASCKILIEDILGEQDFIKNARVNLKKEVVEVETNSDKTPEEIVNILNSKMKNNGYTFSEEKIIKEKESNNNLWTAIPIGILFLVLFFILQKSGILNLGIGGGTTPTTSFLIGIIASLSSCLAIVGGLILSLSAKVAQDEGGKTAKKPIILFHAGRLFGFAILGGVLGLIGKAIGISFLFSAILGLIASVVMIMLGLNLLGVFKKNKITLPSSIFSFFRKAEHAIWAPILIGLGTFFLPCGFTQSMQISALSSGSFFSGFMIMFAFALGTLPVLGLLSFGSVSFAQSKNAPLFFKTAGVVVVGLGAFALLSGLAGVGLINPLFNI